MMHLCATGESTQMVANWLFSDYIPIYCKSKTAECPYHSVDQSPPTAATSLSEEGILFEIYKTLAGL